MSGIKTLVRHSSHYLTGQVCAMAIGLVSFPYLTRVLSVADYGTMELIGRLALLGTAAGKLGVQHSVLRYFNPKTFAESSDLQRRFYSTSILGAMGTAALAGLVTLMAYLYATGGEALALPLALAAGALALIRAVYSILCNLLRAEQRTGLYTAVNTWGRALTVGGILALFALSQPNLRLYFAVTVGVELTIVALLTAWLARRGLIAFGSFDRPLFASMVAFGLPMVAYETLLVALEAVDRFLIRGMLGANPLGYYAAAYTICIYIQDLLMVPINLAMLPLYLKLYNTEGAARTAEFLTDSFRLFVLAAGCLLAGVTACATSGVTLIASAKYAQSALLIPWIVGGLVLYAANAFLSAPLMIEKRTTTMAMLVASALVVKVALNLLLLPRMGLYGAAVSTIIGYLFLLGMTAYHSLRLMPIGVDVTLIAKTLICGAAAALAALQIHLDFPAAELLARATCVLSLYVLGLGLFDRTARQLLQQGFSVARRQIQLLAATSLTLAGGLS
jgi:O-antigen/teichoic acid export membrane protein